MAIDAKKIDVAELGEDVIKAQQAANLKHSSSDCAILPEDQAQTMLAGVSALFRIRTRPFFDIFTSRIRTCFIASNPHFRLLRAMQMLQISGVLELRSHQLRRHALKMINATICGTATTEFWRLMESYFGVDEDPDEAALQDTQSLADILAQKKAWSSEDVPSVPKEAGLAALPAPEPPTQEQPPEVIIDDDDDNVSLASVHTTQSTGSTSSAPLKTLAAKKKETVSKYPSACSLKEASLFYPTSDSTLHATGVDAKYITDRKKIGSYGSYKGYYCCAWQDCDYAAQTHGAVATHVRRVHLGHALACRFCPTMAWWQARYWSDHMDRFHSDQAKYEAVTMPEGIKAEEVTEENIPEEDHYVIQQSWNFPQTRPSVPIHRTEPKREAEVEVAEVHESSKKRKFAGSDLEELFDTE